MNDDLVSGMCNKRMTQDEVWNTKLSKDGEYYIPRT